MEQETPTPPVAPEETKSPEELKAEEAKAARQVLREKKIYEDATVKWRTEIQEIWKAMNGELSANVYPWENPQFVPKIRTEVSFVVPFIFSGDPQMEVTLIGDEDRDIAYILDKMLSYRIEKNPRFFDQAVIWVTQGVGLGTSLMKVYWDFKKKGGKIIDRPCYSVPNILDIYRHPTIVEMDDQTSVIERSTRTVADVKKDPAYGPAKLEVKPSKRHEKSTYGSDTLDAADLDDVDSMNDEFNFVDIYERWSDEEIVTIADSGEGPILLRKEPNPYGFVPYAVFIFENEIIPNRANGKGVGQNTIGLQEMYYDLFNLVMLNLKIVVNKMWRVDPGSRVDPKDLIARPGGTIRATKDEAEWVEQSDLKQSGFEMLALISDEHKRASGATDLIQGSTSSRTFGQDQLAQANVSNRFELVRRRLKAALSRIGWMTLKMELQNLQSVDQEIMRIFPVAERETIFALLVEMRDNLDFDVKITGDTMVAPNKDVLAKQLLDLFNLIAPTMNPQEQRVYAREIARMRGMANVQELIPDFQMPGQMQPATRDIFHQFPAGAGASYGEPMDGNAFPERTSVTQESINESTYGGGNSQV